MHYSALCPGFHEGFTHWVHDEQTTQKRLHVLIKTQTNICDRSTGKYIFTKKFDRTLQREENSFSKDEGLVLVGLQMKKKRRFMGHSLGKDTEGEFHSLLKDLKPQPVQGVF